MWFENQAEEAADFYVSIFHKSKIGNIARYDDASAEVSGRPKGSVMTIEFQLEGQTFSALNGGPEFKFSPAVSFFVSCETERELEGLWAKLIDGGKALMALDKYPFSKKYGWLEDKFGVSWQLNLAPYDQKITPALLFVGSQNGKAEEAMNMYVSLFENSKVEMVDRYVAGDGDTEGAVKHAKFSLDGYKFIAMDSGLEHAFDFSQAISFLVNCKTQAEVDKFWQALSEGGEKQVCGWLRDKYGITWQVTPTILDELLNDPDKEKASRVMQAMLKMTKIDIAELQKAADAK